MRQPRIGRADRTHQRIDDLALDAVVEMAGIGDILEAAPAVGNLLVLGERVGDERKGPLVGLERLGQCLPGRLALCAVTVLQQVQRRLDRQFLGRDLEAQARDGLVEQPVPGGIAALGFLVKQLLDAILELIGLFLAQILDPRPIMRQFGRLQRAFDHGIVDPVQFEPEEQQMHRCIGQPLGDVAVEFGDRGIDAVAGVNQPGIGAETAGEIVDRLKASHRLREPGAAALLRRLFGEFALVVGLKRDAIGIHLFQVAGDFRRVDTGIEIGQIPFRQFAGLVAVPGFGRGFLGR